MVRDGDPPFYGQPGRRPLNRGDILRLLKDIFAEGDIMGINEREIAGVSITRITNDLLVSPVEFDGVDTVSLRIQATSETEPDARYIVRLKLDRPLGDILLPLQSVVFTQSDIDGQAIKIMPFALEGIDFNDVSGFIAEVFLDGAIADVEMGVANGSLSGGVVNHDILMNVGSGGLAGFTIDLTIDNPTIAKFMGATFPADFPLADFSPDPVDGPLLSITGIDLGDTVNAFEMAVRLATVEITPLAIGISPITAVISRLDNEAGFPMQAVINNGSIVVTA